MITEALTIPDCPILLTNVSSVSLDAMLMTVAWRPSISDLPLPLAVPVPAMPKSAAVLLPVLSVTVRFPEPPASSIREKPSPVLFNWACTSIPEAELMSCITSPIVLVALVTVIVAW